MIIDAVFLLASVFLEGQDLCSLLPVVLQALGGMGRLLSMRCEVFEVHIFQDGVNPFCLQFGLLIWAFVLRRTLKRKKSLGLSKCFLLEVANIILNLTGGKGRISDKQRRVTKASGFIFSSNTRQQTSKRQGGRAEVPVLDHILSLIHFPEKEDITALSQAWVALVVLPHIR